MQKYFRAGQATDDNMAQVRWMMGTSGYKHTLRICNTFAFPQQQCLHEHTSLLLYTYIVCLVRVKIAVCITEVAML